MPKLLKIARMGEKILKQKALYVALKDIKFYQSSVEDMIFTLKSFRDRIGLAAPQVFINKRIVIFSIPKNKHPRYKNQQQEVVPLTVMFNPIWHPLTSEKTCGWEACISIPNIVGIVPRYLNIEYEYFDILGNKHNVIASGFHARVIQHECDHLEGILFPSNMTDLNSLGFEDISFDNNEV
jgi:peptide deformylase